MKPTRLARASEAYVTRVMWPVFPCVPRGKEPLTANGFLDATLDVEQVRSWWKRWPNANIGIATDERSGLLAIDVDPRHGGDEELAALEDEFGKLPATIEALTGGRDGGRHILFRRPKNARFRSQLCRGVDVKSDGYIIGAPSVHPDGGTYCWEAMSRPLEVELADLPSWVLGRILNYEPEGAYGVPADDAAKSFLARAFGHAGWLGRRIDAHRIVALCPWADEHTVGSPDSSTIIFAPRNGSGAGWFHCSHTSHGPKTMAEVIAALPYDACRLADADICEELAHEAAGDDEYERAERLAIQMEGECT